MAARGQLQFFFVGAKTLNLKVGIYSNFIITFPSIWGCAGDFFRVLLKFKMAARINFNFLGGAKKIVRSIFF